MFAASDIPAGYRKFAAGSLVVRLRDDTFLGVSDSLVPKGAIGFVQSSRDGRAVVHFPWVPCHGVVPVASYEAIGHQPR